MIYDKLKKNPMFVVLGIVIIILLSFLFSKVQGMTTKERMKFVMENPSLFMYLFSIVYAAATTYFSAPNEKETMKNIDDEKDESNKVDDGSELLKKIKKLEKSRNTHIIFLSDSKGKIPKKLNKHFISTDDENRFLHKFSLIDSKDTVELIITTDGGSFFPFEQYAKIILEQCNAGKVISYVPYKAFSGGSEIVLSSSEICMYPKALLSPTDVQIVTKDKETSSTSFAAKTIINAFKDNCTTDTTKLLNEKAKQHYEYSISQTKQRLSKNYDEDTVAKVLDKFVSGDIIHDSSYNVSDLRDMGLKINTDIDKEIRSMVNDVTNFFDNMDNADFISNKNYTSSI